MVRKIIIWCEENKTKSNTTDSHYINVENMYEFFTKELKKEVVSYEKRKALKIKHIDKNNQE